MNQEFIIKTLIVLMLGACSLSSFAQENKKSSYDRLRKSSQREIPALLNEAEQTKEVSPQQALEKVKEALAISISQQDVLAEGRCYNLLGDINMTIQEWKLSLENFLTAYEKLSTNFSGTRDFQKTLYGLAQANLKLFQYDAALVYADQLITQKLGAEERNEAHLLRSEIYYQMGRYTEALQALESVKNDLKRANPSLEVAIENQKAKIFARTNQMDEASKRFQSGQNISRANTAAEQKREEASVRSAKEEIAGVLDEQKRYDEKIELLNSSITYNIDVKNPGEVSKDKVELGKTLLAKGETAAAIRELEEAAFIADTIGDPKKQADAYLSLADLYSKYGNTSGALATYKKYSQAVFRSEKQNESKLLEKSELIKTQRDIEELSKFVTVSRQEETIAQALVFRQQLIIYGLILIILIVVVTSYFIYKNAQASKTANQLLALKSLRSQMNPHFIFNALNSVNHFVSQHDERTTNKFLSEFSRLMRLVLENSQQDFIPLLKEEEIISLYLKLEHYRFRDKFDYSIEIDEQINREAIEIPPMLIQPYIENAVWHGLRYRETKGFLSVTMTQEEDVLKVIISDNGIGRARSAALKTDNQKKHQSTGLKNIRERLGIINMVYKSSYKVEIEDLENHSGTRVTLTVPINQKHLRYA